jgi:hypothetical protein
MATETKPSQHDPVDPRIPLLNKRLSALKGDRSTWENYWEDLAKYNLPRKDNVYGSRIDGDQMNTFLYDSTSVHANELLASALHGMLTNPMTTFFAVSSGDLTIDRVEKVAKWLDDVTEITHSYLDSSNFQTEIHEVYLDLGGFGTGAMLIEDDDDDVFRFEAMPIYHIYIAESKRGLVDTVFKTMERTIRELADEFGQEWMTEDLVAILMDKPDTKYEYCHAVFPRGEAWIDPKTKRMSKKHPKRLPVASFHFLSGKQVMIKEGGFHEFPYVVPRWSKNSGEKYGRGPAMKALPDTKSLNSMMDTALRAGKISLAPPLQVVDQGVMRKVKMKPGAVNFVRPGAEIKPIITGSDFRHAADEMIEMRTRIKQAFFIDQLQMESGGPAMTATEVMQRTEEKLRLMGPVLGRQQFELLRPTIERVVSILARKGLLPEPPAEIAELGTMKIKYSSMIAKAQKASELDNFNRFYSLVAALAEFNPEVMDILDADDIVREAAHLLSIRQKSVKDKEVVAKVREDRQTAIKEQQELENKNTESGTVSNLANAAAKTGEVEGGQQ